MKMVIAMRIMWGSIFNIKFPFKKLITTLINKIHANKVFFYKKNKDRL